MSQVAVNLAPLDAKYCSFFADPPMPKGLDGVHASDAQPGSLVVVHCDSSAGASESAGGLEFSTNLLVLGRALTSPKPVGWIPSSGRRLPQTGLSRINLTEFVQGARSFTACHARPYPVLGLALAAAALAAEVFDA